jgi:hypothetical protein
MEISREMARHCIVRYCDPDYRELYSPISDGDLFLLSIFEICRIVEAEGAISGYMIDDICMRVWILSFGSTQDAFTH